MTVPDVSIIIVNWNTKDILRDCLNSIHRETQGIQFETILIDNASTDGSVEMIKKDFPQVILIENQDNRGFAAANNQGMKIAQGRYVLLLNPDSVIEEGAIQKSISFADGYPSAGVVGIKTFFGDGQLQQNCFQYASILNLLISTIGLRNLFPKHRLWGRERYMWWDYKSVKEVDVVTGCYMLVRREVLKEVGLMDEEYFMYGEEMDWCWRINNSGWKVVFYPQAQFIHYGGISSEQNPINMRNESRKSFLRFIRKRQGIWAKYFALILLFVGGLYRLTYWVIRLIVPLNKKRPYVIRKIRESLNHCLGA